MKKQNFLRGSAILALSAAAAKILGALFKIPLAEMLGGAGMGYFSSAYGLFLPVYAVFVSGLSSAASILVSEAFVISGAEGAAAIRRKSLRLFTFTGMAGMIFIVLFAVPFSDFILDDHDAFLPVMLIAPSVLFGCITAVYRGSFEGIKNMYPTAFSQFAESAVKLAAGLFFGKAASDNYDIIIKYIPLSENAVSAAGAVFGVTVSSFAGMLAVIIMSRKKAEKYGDHINSVPDCTYRKVISVALPVAVGALIPSLSSLADLATIMRQIKRCFNENKELLSIRFPFVSDMDEREFAVFAYGAYSGLAVTVYNIIPSFTNVLGKSVIPFASQAWISDDKAGFSRHVNTVIRIIMLVSVPAGFGIGVLAGPVLHILFPSSCDEVVIAEISLMVLAPSVVFVCLTYPVFSILQSAGRTDIPVKIMIPALAVKIAGNCILIPMFKFNIAGAAVSTSLCYLFIAVTGLLCLKKICSADIDLKSSVLNPLYSGMLCAGAAFLCRNRMQTNGSGDAAVIAVSALCGAAVYVFSLYMLGDPAAVCIFSGKKDPPDVSGG